MNHSYHDNVIFKPPKLKLVLGYIEKSRQNCGARYPLPQRKLRHFKLERCRTLIFDRWIVRDSQSEFLRYMKPIDHNNFLSWS